jgi:hypothetical protein
MVCSGTALPFYKETVEVLVATGRTMAQAVSRWPLTAEVRVRAWCILCGICGGQSGAGTAFSQNSSVFPCQCHSTVAFRTHIHLGMNNRPIRGCSSET